MYAKIIISISHKDIDKVFLYEVPESMRPHIKIGQSVAVPFGRGNTQNEGFVTGLTDECGVDADKLKQIIRINELTPFFSEKTLALAEWMRNKYYCTLYDCLKCIMPSGIQHKNDVLVALTGEPEKSRASAKQGALIAFLKEQNGAALKTEIENQFGQAVSGTIKALEAKGIVELKNTSDCKNLTLKMKFAYINYENEIFEDELYIDELAEKSAAQAKVLRLLFENDGVAVSDIKKYLNISNAPIGALEGKGLIKTEIIEVLRNTVHYDGSEKPRPHTLSAEQQKAVSFIESKKDLKPVLIHGITGSGKTEIYMRVIEKAIREGKQAIMLVPEISLTAQTVNIFLDRFGSLVTVTHSRLTLGERYDQWKKAADGRTSIMIGPRSAIFAPFKNLGVIIIDEEHEKTYKSETTPKFGTKEVAVERGRLENAQVILGSATPSIETYFEAQNGKMDLITLSERINRKVPEIRVVDMREELVRGNMSIFGTELYDAIKENLQKREQSILFLNRRGFSTFVSCRKCGYVMMCESCNVNYTYHLSTGKLICHYCGKKIKNPSNCPQCGSKYIKYFGVGTQRVEEEIHKIFPKAVTLRMDYDTTSGKHTHDRILNEFRSGGADILIGTQMIAKGLDFPNVSLVGIIAADLSLNSGDFRAGETTYQLLTQVSGRAGRAAIDGRVYIQTYNPEHYSIMYAKESDYADFYTHELSLRRQMMYPPFTHIFSVLIISEDEKKIITTLFKLKSIMEYYNKKGIFEMLGPSPAAVSKIKKRYRWKMIIKSEDEERLKNFTVYCVQKLKETEDAAGLIFQLTLNPVLLL